MVCTQEKLEAFSWRHFTYINQIFGDQTVREIISEVYPSDDYSFKVEEGEGAFEGTDHHVLAKKKTLGTLCSVERGNQNTDVDVNDNLCQSYSLLSYFKIPISKSKKAKQMAMVKMYRTKLLDNKEFVDKLDDVIFPKNKGVWINNTRTPKDTYPLQMNKANILAEIRKTLNEWESYGYNHFIGTGTCPIAKKPATRRTRKAL